MKGVINNIARAFGVGVLIVVLNFFFQLPSVSYFIKSFFFEYGTLNSAQYWFFELFVNMSVSAAITSLAFLLVRSVALLTVVISIGVQILWYFIFHRYYASPDSIGELLFRSSGFIGIVLGAYLPLFVIQQRQKQKNTK